MTIPSNACELAVDLAYTASFEELLNQLAEFQLKMLIVEPHGPAGGNPYVKFIGPAGRLHAFRIKRLPGCISSIEPYNPFCLSNV